MKRNGPTRLTRPSTIADVARIAEVSASTVSRVLRDHPDVGSATRERVQRAIADLSYRPSNVARALASGRSLAIGLLVSDIANPFYPQLAKSIEQQCRDQGYSMVICNTDDDAARSVEYVERLLDQGVEGFVHASVGQDEAAVIEAIADARRIVFANRRPRSRSVSYVVSDNVAGARLLAEHLLAQGHRRIGFLSGPAWASSVAERLEGLNKAAEVAGGTILVAEGDFTATNALEAVRNWVAMPDPPTAIVGINDRVAAGIYAALVDLGVPVPSRVAVAGFDNIEFVWARAMPITSVAQRTDVMGKRAVDILLRQLDSSSQRITRQQLTMDLVVRDTTR